MMHSAPDRDPDGFSRIHAAYQALSQEAVTPASEKVSLSISGSPVADQVSSDEGRPAVPPDLAERAQRERAALRAGHGDLDRWRASVIAAGAGQVDVLDQLVDAPLLAQDILAGHENFASALLPAWQEQGKLDRILIVAEAWLTASMGPLPPFAARVELFLARALVWTHPGQSNELADLAFRHDRSAVDPNFEIERAASAELTKVSGEHQNIIRSFLRGDLHPAPETLRQVRQYIHSSQLGPLRRCLEAKLIQYNAAHRSDTPIGQRDDPSSSSPLPNLSEFLSDSNGKGKARWAWIFGVLLLLAIVRAGNSRSHQQTPRMPLLPDLPRSGIEIDPHSELRFPSKVAGAFVAAIVLRDPQANTHFPDIAGVQLEKWNSYSNEDKFWTAFYERLLSQKTHEPIIDLEVLMAFSFHDERQNAPMIFAQLAETGDPARRQRILDLLADYRARAASPALKSIPPADHPNDSGDLPPAE